MGKSRLLVCNIENIDKARFFYRFNDVCRKNDIEVIYIVQSYSAFVWLLTKGAKVKFIKKCTNNIIVNHRPDIELKNTVDFKLKKYTIEECKMAYKSTVDCLKDIESIHHIDFIFTWSGYKVSDLACGTFAKDNDIKILFFEIANIKGKIFVDGCGTNARSSIQSNCESLRAFKFEDVVSVYNDWLGNYIKEKFAQTTIPQARKNSFGLLLFRVVFDILGVIIGGLPLHLDFLLFKYKERTSSKLNIKYDVIDLSKIEYIFFPLQVSSDVQVMINSKTSLKEALLWATNYAKKNKVALVIKPHPAETNLDIINFINNIKGNYENVYFCNNNTFELISKSEKVITINSTVGLEAKILGKPVEVLGKAFYKDFDEEILMYYITGYLIDIDYFSEDDGLSQWQLESVLKRCD